MINLDFYGIQFSVDGLDSKVLGYISSRFHYFLVDECLDPIKIFFEKKKYDLSALESRQSIGISPRNFFYKIGSLLYADYFGNATSIHNLKNHSLKVYSEDSILVYEIIYLFLLSQVGTLLEKKGIYRVHGIGFEYNGDGHLILLPSGGGKSTLALRLLKQTSCKILSEDSPLIGRKNVIYPLPLGIGTDPKSIGIDVESDDLLTYERMEFPPKTVILPRYYMNRIGMPVRLKTIIVGKRCLGNDARIVRAGSFHIAKNLLTKMVVGIGLFQGIEYLLHRHRLLKIKVLILLMFRFLRMMRMIPRNKKYIFYMGYDYEKNFQVLTKFLSR